MVFPLIIGDYVGVAECVRKRPLELAATKKDEPVLQSAISEMEAELLAAQNGLNVLVSLRVPDFEPSVKNSDFIWKMKSVVDRLPIRTIEKAIKATSGPAYFRRLRY